MSLSAGYRLGPFEIVGPLGSGGMGEVYRAHDARLGRDVAVKVLPSEVSGDPDRRRQLEREARVIAAINHPSICALYDVGHDRGVDFLVMELLEGESLATRLGRGPVPSDEAVRVGLAILEALHALHEPSLVHRDLKPSNVFLSRHGVKLLDFGLARPQHPAGVAGDRSMTQPGMLVGTPRYMAPEQVKGGPIDARTDIFAAAAVIYEMLAGRVPFEGDTLVAVLHAVAYEEPPPLPAGAAPEALECALRQALSKDPADRPASAEAFAGTLREALAAWSGVFPTVGPAPRRRALTRVIVLPLRILRSDAETDFLAFSLADAVAASLASLDSLTVRSSLTATRFADQSPDLRRLGEEAQVDLALDGVTPARRWRGPRRGAARRGAAGFARLVAYYPGAGAGSLPAAGRPHQRHRVVAGAAAHRARPECSEA